MVTSILDLLKFKRKIELKSKDTVLAEVWLKILGDWDLQQAYRIARLESARKRNSLRDENSEDYLEGIATIPETTSRKDCIELIKNAQTSIFVAQAYATIQQEDPPKIDQFAEIPDGPTLEEQEQLDKAIEEYKEKYEKNIEQNVNDRLNELELTLLDLPDEEVFTKTQQELITLLAQAEFSNELEAQKCFRATFLDELCKKPAFETVAEFKNLHPSIKLQISREYDLLEISPDEIKNS